MQNWYYYQPFGQTTQWNTPMDTLNPVRFTGREDDGDGLYYYRARYYSPDLGRFISEDPIGFEGASDSNLYAYAGNNPADFTDSRGLAVDPKDKEWCASTLKKSRTSRTSCSVG